MPGTGTAGGAVKPMRFTSRGDSGTLAALARMPPSLPRISPLKVNGLSVGLRTKTKNGCGVFTVRSRMLPTAARGLFGSVLRISSGRLPSGSTASVTR